MSPDEAGGFLLAAICAAWAAVGYVLGYWNEGE